MKIRIFCSLTLVAIAFLMGSATGAAAWGGCPCHFVQKAHDVTRTKIEIENDKVRKQVKTSIEQQTVDMNAHHDLKTLEIIAALRGLSRENSNHQQLQVEANKRFGDAAEINAMNRLRDEFRAKAESGNFDPTPDSCLMLDMYRNGGSGGIATGATGSDVTRDVVEWIHGGSAVVQTGGAALSRHVFDMHQEYETFGGSTHGTTDWGLILDHPTIDFSDPQMTEVVGIIQRNLLDSTPEQPVSNEEQRDSSGQDRIAKNEEIRSRLQAGAEAVEMVLNMRTATMDGEPVEAFRAMAEQSAYNRPIIDNKLSELQQIDIQTVFHYAPSGDRAVTMASSHGINVKGWLHEIHRVISLNTRLQYLQLELASRVAVVNAGILASLNDNE